MCDRGGKKRDKKNPNLLPSRRRKDMVSHKTECPFKVQAHRLPNGEWRGSIKEGKKVQKDLHKYHNHEASDSPVNHPAFYTSEAKNHTDAYDYIRSVLKNSVPDVKLIIFEVKRLYGIDLKPKDPHNIRQSARTVELGGKTLIQWLVDPDCIET
ncbi:hypothetical protein K3495_g3528 [Podosphaera aphanis]|nr:hypothetical protein K3495_g3528 [Podosphaera aphanis]